MQFCQITRSLFGYLVSSALAYQDLTYRDPLQFRKSASNHSIHQEELLGWSNRRQLVNSRLVVAAAVGVVELEAELGAELGAEAESIQVEVYSEPAKGRSESTQGGVVVATERGKWKQDPEVGVASVPVGQ